MGVEGLEEILAALETVPDRVVAGAKKGLDKGLIKIEGDARKKAPADTGLLRQLIRHTMYEGFGAVSGEVIAGAEYSAYVELGTGPKGQGSYSGPKKANVAYRQSGWVYPTGKGAGKYAKFAFTTGQPARPYLYPAFKANKSRVIGFIAKAIKEEIG